MIKVLFVCHGNICRSPMAEFVMKEIVRQGGDAERFEIASCAVSREEIGNDVHSGTRRKLLEMGVPFERRAAVQLTHADYAHWDWIIAMDTANVRGIERITGGDPAGKIRLLLEFAGSGEALPTHGTPAISTRPTATFSAAARRCMPCSRKSEIFLKSLLTLQRGVL